MIYLDNNATTRVLPEVVEALLPFYNELWGNPSSLYPFGAQLMKPLDQARENVAGLLSAHRESEIVFTSGGTESNNLAIRGLLNATPSQRHLITTSVEHPSILLLCKQLEQEGVTVTYLPVRSDGTLETAQLEKAIQNDTALVSIMWANNETGVIFPIEKVAEICSNKNIPLHVDATQAVGKIPIDLRRIPLSLLSLSGHKLHAPKGIGALYIHRGTKIAPLFNGSQERGRRAGTENVAGIAGLGRAALLARQRLEKGDWKEIQKLRDRFEEEILKIGSPVSVNGNRAQRLPNTSSLSFSKLPGETITLLLGEEGICVSTGSACSAGSLEPSHVLKAMGQKPEQARGTVRFSLSFETTPKEIEDTTDRLKKILNHGVGRRN